MKEQPSYYAILTAEVRYDKNLSAMAKLLYAEITALTQKEGYAWASNSYFAELYGLSAGRISKLVGELKQNNYISVEITDRTYRKIYVKTIAKNNQPLVKNSQGVSQKRLGGLAKNSYIVLQENNIKNKKVDFRGQESQNKEKIRKALKYGKLNLLKTV